MRLFNESAEEGGAAEGDADADGVNNEVEDPWSRKPKSLQDEMALYAAKEGYGEVIIEDLGDERYKGMDKVEVKVKSDSGKDSVVHYVPRS